MPKLSRQRNYYYSRFICIYCIEIEYFIDLYYTKFCFNILQTFFFSKVQPFYHFRNIDFNNSQVSLRYWPLCGGPLVTVRTVLRNRVYVCVRIPCICGYISCLCTLIVETEAALITVINIKYLKKRPTATAACSNREQNIIKRHVDILFFIPVQGVLQSYPNHSI